MAVVRFEPNIEAIILHTHVGDRKTIGQKGSRDKDDSGADRLESQDGMVATRGNRGLRGLRHIHPVQLWLGYKGCCSMMLGSLRLVDHRIGNPMKQATYHRRPCWYLSRAQRSW